jgi:PAS domain S-box-containing protein
MLQENVESSSYEWLCAPIEQASHCQSYRQEDIIGTKFIVTLIFRFTFAGLLLSLPLLQPLWAGQAREIKRVLILYSEDAAHPAHGLTDQGILSIFHSNTLFDVRVYKEYMDVTRFTGPANAQAFADYLARKYAGTKIDTIITVYPAAVEFLLGEAIDVFPDTPVVANQLNRAYAEKLKDSAPRRAITGTITGDNAAGVLDSAYRIRPGTKRVALVAGTAPNNVYSEQVFRKGLEPYLEKLELINLTKLSMEETLTRVSALPPDTIVLYAAITSDGEGRSFVPREALLSISRAANAPVFGLYDSFMGYGIVGGRLVSWEQLGIEAADMALRIMDGEPAASIPFGGETAYVDIYDWRELKRWNIPASAVPSGSEIRFRVPSMWEEHRQAIIGAIALMAIETFLILGLVINLRRRRLAEQSLSESEARLSLAAASANAGLWSMSVDTGQAWATDKIRELFGFPPHEELHFESFLGRIHPEDRERVQRTVQQAMQSRENFATEYRVLRSDGSVRWIASRGRLQPTKAGKPSGVMGVSVDVSERKETEDALRRSEQDLSKLAGRIIHAQEEELRRLSRELHDDLTQRLAALALDAALIEKELNPLPPHAVQGFKELRANLSEVAEEVHDLSRQLHPSILDDLGLVQAVQAECAAFTRKTGIDMSFAPYDFPDSVSHQSALCLYRVIREALQNISKHSRAASASITLQGLSDGIRLLIADKGIGFDPQGVKTKAGIGLSSMRERVRLVNGTISFESNPGQGSEIEVFIPIGGEHDQATAVDSRRPSDFRRGT